MPLFICFLSAALSLALRSVSGRQPRRGRRMRIRTILGSMKAGLPQTVRSALYGNGIKQFILHSPHLALYYTFEPVPGSELAEHIDVISVATGNRPVLTYYGGEVRQYHPGGNSRPTPRHLLSAKDQQDAKEILRMVRSLAKII